MSADLWAAFTDEKVIENPWSTVEQTETKDAIKQSYKTKDPEQDPRISFDIAESTSVLQATPTADDEWSAFESAGPIHPAVDHQWSTLGQVANKEAARAPGNTFDSDGLMWDADLALDTETEQEPQGSKPLSGSFQSRANPNTLVSVSTPDLSTAEAEDDFGDFETAEPFPLDPTTKETASSTIMQNRIYTQGKTAANPLLFGAMQKGSASNQVAQKQATTGLSTQSRSKPLAKGSREKSLSAGSEVSKSKKSVSISPSTDVGDEDAWDDFTSLPAQAPSNPLEPSATPAAPNSSSTATTETMRSTLPPSNIPPPSILLSLFSNKILPDLTKAENGLLPGPSLRTAAHILAGRKQRWKRDTHLVQSMSISASAPGLKSGMKLAGVDKAESVREDREAAEVVRIYRQNIGALRARALKSGEKSTIDLGGSLMLKTEKAGNGVVGGTKPCIICGLRRAERVNSVDVDVYDGFGEWWVEHWGHRECKEWWEANETKLDKR